MSKILSRKSYWAFLALVGCVILGSQIANAQDILKNARAKQELQAQKFESEISTALSQVRKLERSEPGEAISILRNYQVALENDNVLSSGRRQKLLTYVNSRLRELERKLPARTKVNPTKSREQDIRAKYENLLSGKRGPLATGKSPFQIADRMIKSGQSQLEREYQMKVDRNSGFVSVVRSVEKSATPTSRDLTFPKNWKQIVARRPRGPKLTKKEAQLLKTLNSVLTVNFEREPFKDVITYLQEKTGQAIIVDPNALKEVFIEYDTPVTFQGPKVSIRVILKSILRPLGLTYVLRDGIIQVVTPQRAREMMVTRSYPIAGLLPVPDFRFGPFFNRAQKLHYVSQLMYLIQTTVEPASWSINGGGGTIWYHEPSNTIVIRQSAELHLSLGSSLGLSR